MQPIFWIIHASAPGVSRQVYVALDGLYARTIRISLTINLLTGNACQY